MEDVPGCDRQKTLKMVKHYRGSCLPVETEFLISLSSDPSGGSRVTV